MGIGKVVRKSAFSWVECECGVYVRVTEVDIELFVACPECGKWRMVERAHIFPDWVEGVSNE